MGILNFIHTFGADMKRHPYMEEPVSEPGSYCFEPIRPQKLRVLDHDSTIPTSQYSRKMA